jgi:hypothetical protein
MANIRALRFSMAAGRLSWIMGDFIVDWVVGVKGEGLIKREAFNHRVRVDKMGKSPWQ